MDYTHPQLAPGVWRVEYHVRGVSIGIKQVRKPVSPFVQAGVLLTCDPVSVKRISKGQTADNTVQP